MHRLIRKLANPFGYAIKEVNNFSSLTVFSSKAYDQKYFQYVNSTLPAQDRFRLDFIKTKFNQRMASLIPQGCKTIVCFVNDKLDSSSIKALKKRGVDLIALRCAGFNNIDLLEAQRQDIAVVRVPAYSPHAVAEHAIALLMTLNRKLHKAYNRTRQNNFSVEGLIGFDLFEKKVGIIGLGKIGKQFARICNGFGMKILVYDVSLNSEYFDKSYMNSVDLDYLLSNSDVISLHCPLNSETFHIINEQSISKMKKNCIIINTGRGGLINAEETMKALGDRKIGGLALDVYEQEQQIFFNDLSETIVKDAVLLQLLSYPNVLITSHQGFLTHEALTQIAKVTLNNILEYRKAGECINTVKQK